MRQSPVLGSVVLIALGCTTVADPVGPEVVELSRRDLSALGSVSGISVERTTRDRFVLAVEGRVLRLESAGAVEVFRAPFAVPPPGFTDLVALGDETFALTAVSNGFLADATTGTLSVHFCYEPGFWDPNQFGTPSVQVTQALTFDPGEGLFYAQPRTVGGEGTGEIFESLVASYDPTTGNDIGWWTLEDTQFTAGGMGVSREGSRTEPAELVFGSGTWLYRYDLRAGTPIPFADLRDHVSEITGLAIDEVAGTLLVIDQGRELVELSIRDL